MHQRYMGCIIVNKKFRELKGEMRVRMCMCVCVCLSATTLEATSLVSTLKQGYVQCCFRRLTIGQTLATFLFQRLKFRSFATEGCKLCAIVLSF